MKLLKIVDATHSGGLTVSLTFADGKVQTVDIGEFLERRPHPQYNKYKDVKNFKKFKIENGNIVWGENRDLSFHRDELYAGKINI